MVGLLWIFVFGIIIVCVISDEGHVAIEQTNGYKDTWMNNNATCSLLAIEHTGSMWQNQFTVVNANDIRGTGWISAHIERDGTLYFAGCVIGYVRNYAPRLEVSQHRIPECIYFCGSNDILLHRNFCYCARNVDLHQYSLCSASQCGNDEPLFCGQSSKCMCRYQTYSTYINSYPMIDSCENHNMTNCTLSQWRWFTLRWQVICNRNCHCNGYVPREAFYWGAPLLTNNNRDYCVAVRKLNTSGKLMPVTLNCSTKLTGICKKGTKISTTLPTTHLSTTSFPTTDEYDFFSSVITSHKILKHTPQDTVPNSYSSKYVNTDTLPDATTRLNMIESTTYIDDLTSMKMLQTSSEYRTDHQTNILGPVIGGVGTFVVIIIVSVAVIVIFIRKRRREKHARCELPRQLHKLSTGKQHQNQYMNYTADNPASGNANRKEDNEEYDTFTRSSKPESGYDLYDHTSGIADNMYGRLNRNKNSSPVNSDIYDHSRPAVNGDTYDSFQAGVRREDSSNDYYDHTVDGETYGNLGKRVSGMEPADDMYDHSGAIVRGNGDMYDYFQAGRGGQEIPSDSNEYSQVNTGYS